MEQPEVMQALFISQRLQLLDMAEKLPPHYVFAWDNLLYPFLDDTDGSIARRPHEIYESFFHTQGKKGHEVLGYLADSIQSESHLTYYDFEREFGGKDERHDLIDICRYLFLRGAFDEGFWNRFLENGECPVEAKSINQDYTHDSLYLI